MGRERLLADKLSSLLLCLILHPRCGREEGGEMQIRTHRGYPHNSAEDIIDALMYLLMALLHGSSGA